MNYFIIISKPVLEELLIRKTSFADRLVLFYDPIKRLDLEFKDSRYSSLSFPEKIDYLYDKKLLILVQIQDSQVFKIYTKQDVKKLFLIQDK